jgi:hypothetical protein
LSLLLDQAGDVQRVEAMNRSELFSILDSVASLIADDDCLEIEILAQTSSELDAIQAFLKERIWATPKPIHVRLVN